MSFDHDIATIFNFQSKKAFKPIEPTFLPTLIFISSVGITVGILGIA